MIRCITFDMDDTLYDERDYCYSGYRAVAQYLLDRFEQVNVETLFLAMKNEFDQGDRGRIFNAALEKAQLDPQPDLIEKLVEVYRSHRPDLTLPQESRDVLEMLAREYQLALLTDGFLPAQRYKVESLQIADYFKCIVYTEQLGREYWKPSPVGFQKILADLNIEGEQCVYVADNAAKDFIAPNQLGFVTVQILRPNRVHDSQPDKDDAIPDHKIENLMELPALIQTL